MSEENYDGLYYSGAGTVWALKTLNTDKSKLLFNRKPYITEKLLLVGHNLNKSGGQSDKTGRYEQRKRSV